MDGSSVNVFLTQTSPQLEHEGRRRRLSRPLSGLGPGLRRPPQEERSRRKLKNTSEASLRN